MVHAADVHQNTDLKLEGLATGIYMALIGISDGTWRKVKLVKQ